jgi:transmembrane sensor
MVRLVVMTDRSGIDDALLARYLAGECSDAERGVVDSWAAADPRHARQLEVMRVGWEQAKGLPEARMDALWRSVERRMTVDVARDDRAVSGAPLRRWGTVAELRRRWWQRSIPFAAGVLAASVAIWFVATVRAPRDPAPPGRVYRTASGERETVTLGDGTRFTLAPASRMRLAANYGRDRRDVYLEGQAYFAVAHDAARPFVVHAANAVTEDVGTRFVVRSYPEDRAVRVVVTEGAVSLGDSGGRSNGRAVLGQRTVGEVDRRGTTTLQRGADVDADVAWTRGELTFNKTPVREVVVELSRWYGLQVQLADSTMASLAYTASFKDEAVTDVLQSVATAIGARVVRNGQRVVLVRAMSSVDSGH